MTGVWLNEAAVDAIRAALDGASVRCQFHGTEFGRSAGWERGQPRCESCRQPWRVGRARTFLADAPRYPADPSAAFRSGLEAGVRWATAPPDLVSLGAAVEQAWDEQQNGGGEE